MTRQPLITPDTKVGVLLDAHPELESVLIELTPPFRKLRNPVLRRTVARLTSLTQAARVAGLDVRDLVVSLRKAVGQDVSDSPTDVAGGGALPTTRPEWIAEETVTVRLDADELLRTDELPLEAVTRRLRSLPPGEWLELHSSFHPAPLLDALRRQRHEVICIQPEGGSYATYVSPRGLAGA